jgi:hypothetical protein
MVFFLLLLFVVPIASGLFVVTAGELRPQFGRMRSAARSNADPGSSKKMLSTE